MIVILARPSPRSNTLTHLPACPPSPSLPSLTEFVSSVLTLFIYSPAVEPVRVSVVPVSCVAIVTQCICIYVLGRSRNSGGKIRGNCLSLFTQPKFQTTLSSLSLTLLFPSSSSSIETSIKASTFDHHFCSKSRKEGIFGVVKRISTCGTSKFQFVMSGCLITWMLGKLGRIDGDPALRGTRISATWEYVSSVGEWYLEICRGGQETLGTSGGVLLPKTKLDQSRPNPGIEQRPQSKEACVVAGQLWTLIDIWDMASGNRLPRASGNRLPSCVIDYTEEHVTGNRLPVMFHVLRLCNSSLASGNRLPRLCNRLPEMKSLEIPLLLTCSGYGTHCVATVIVMAAQLIHDRVEMECLEGAWETLEGNTRCRFRGTIRFTATSLVHPDEPARTLQRTVEWILPTPTPYRLVEPVQVIEVTSSEEDPEEDLEELPPEPAVDALDFLEGDEDPLPEVDSPEDVMSASEVDSTEDSGPREMATSGGSSS
ncbi:hypothetical protein HKD37_19G053582 [Glycine soja]